MATEYRYLRWVFADFYVNTFNELTMAEIEAMVASAPSTDICTGGSAYSSLSSYTSTGTVLDNTFSADKCFDNNTSTKWATALLNYTLNLMDAYIEYDLGSGVKKQPNKYTITVPSDFYQYPIDWKFMLSNDRNKWVTADSRTGESFTLGQQKTYTFTWYTISGNVQASGVDQTSRPVIILKNSDFSYLGETITDSNGDYSIDVPITGDVLVVCKGASGQRPAAHTVTVS